MRIIGDVHGRYENYLRCLDGCTNSIQIGDMGLDYSELKFPSIHHRFFRGNHDNWDEMWHPNMEAHYISVLDWWHNDVMYAAGAASIDVATRTLDYIITGRKSWWYEEEISLKAMDAGCRLYKNVKPSIMLSHDCPVIMQKYLESQGSLDLRRFGFPKNFSSRTQVFLDTLFSIHQPQLWVFGHWHRNVEKKIGKTTFICLDELSWIDVTFDGPKILLNGVPL